MYEQVIQPNFSAVGSIGYCEQYVERLFGQGELARSAWEAWLKTPVKHYDQNFPTSGVIVLYFSYTATINGVTKNWGHITALDTAKGIIWSAPWKAGTTHAELNSIAQVEQLYTTHENGGVQKVTYVAWSEYLANVIVAQPQGNDMTQAQATELSLYLRLLAGETVDQANLHAANDVQHMMADPGYAAAMAQQLYQGEWQPFAWKATHYDALAQTAEANANTTPTVVVNGQPWGPVKAN